MLNAHGDLYSLQRARLISLQNGSLKLESQKAFDS